MLFRDSEIKMNELNDPIIFKLLGYRIGWSFTNFQIKPNHFQLMLLLSVWLPHIFRKINQLSYQTQPTYPRPSWLRLSNAQRRAKLICPCLISTPIWIESRVFTYSVARLFTNEIKTLFMRIERLNSESDIIYSRISFAFRRPVKDDGQSAFGSHTVLRSEKREFFCIKSSEMKAKETFFNLTVNFDMRRRRRYSTRSAIFASDRFSSGLAGFDRTAIP